MLTFVDFVPTVTKQGWFSSEYESLRECLDRANEWIEGKKPDIVNVETVVLTGMGINSEAPGKNIGNESQRQFIRIWYRV
jgi:hypothetical protein